jgi:hypothetical protein
MGVDAAQWCICCGGPPECAITVERNGVFAHYGACFEHVHEVADRMLVDMRVTHPERKAIT